MSVGGGAGRRRGDSSAAKRRSRRPGPRQRDRSAFRAGEGEGRAALMPYMMAGYPDRETSLAVAAAYADAGPT